MFSDGALLPLLLFLLFIIAKLNHLNVHGGTLGNIVIEVGTPELVLETFLTTHTRDTAATAKRPGQQVPRSQTPIKGREDIATR